MDDTRTLNIITDIILQKLPHQIPQSELFKAVEIQTAKTQNLIKLNDERHIYALVMLQVLLYLLNGAPEDSAIATELLADSMGDQNMIDQSALTIYNDYMDVLDSISIVSTEAQSSNSNELQKSNSDALYRITEILITKKPEEIKKKEIEYTILEQTQIINHMLKENDQNVVQAFAILQCLYYLKNGDLDVQVTKKFNREELQGQVTIISSKIYKDYTAGLAKDNLGMKAKNSRASFKNQQLHENTSLKRQKSRLSIKMASLANFNGSLEVSTNLDDLEVKTLSETQNCGLVDLNEEISEPIRPIQMNEKEVVLVQPGQSPEMNIHLASKQKVSTKSPTLQKKSGFCC